MLLCYTQRTMQWLESRVIDLATYGKWYVELSMHDLTKIE